MTNLFDIQIPISLVLLVPEDPNSTQSHQGRTVEVSSKGMQVQIDEMDRLSYKKISANVRIVQVSLQNTITGQKIQVLGFITWNTYHEAEGSEELAYCRMGILFDKKDEVGLPAYSDFVNSLTRA